jgi:hypothetical protein
MKLRRLGVFQQGRGLFWRHCLARPFLLPFACCDEFSNVAKHLVPGLRLPGGPLENRVNSLPTPGRELAAQPIEPPVDQVGGQLFELGGDRLLPQMDGCAGLR